MAEIRRFPLVRHLRGDQAAETMLYRKGALVRSGRGLSFFFRPMTAAVAEVPLDDREVPFLFHGRTADFQTATVQGTIAYRITAPETLAERVDFTVDLATGIWRHTPLEQLAGLLTQLAQQLSHDYLASAELVAALHEGVEALRSRLAGGLGDDPLLVAMGIDVTAVRVAVVQPTAEMDKALQTPTREGIHQQADEASFARRALAVDKERAIAENELANRIELARREEQLIAEEGGNERRRATEAAEAGRITALAKAEQRSLAAGAEAAAIEAVDGARVAMERDRLDAYRDLPAVVILGLAAKELAANLGKVDHLYLTPDLLGPLAARFLTTGDGNGPGGGDGARGRAA